MTHVLLPLIFPMLLIGYDIKAFCIESKHTASLAQLWSFLDGRSMKVVTDGQESDTHSLNAGVPQGSVLWPTLFLIFIKDLPGHILRSLIDIFDDDTTLYDIVNSRRDHM